MGTVTDDHSDEEDEMTIGIVSDSHPHGDQQLIGYSNITGTFTKEDNSDKEDEMETALSESQHSHDDQQLASHPDSNSYGQPCNSKQQPILDKDFYMEIDLVLISK